MELELKEREAAVGAYSLDLLAKDVGRDRAVIIENQLNTTDHDHLGKLLTYAAGHNAGSIVWIAREMREEHRQALDWLNQRTDVETEFYGVVVELFRIDESRPAFNFKLVAFPNPFAKSHSGEATAPSQRSEAYRAYFQELIDELRERHKFTSARIGQAQSWYAFSSGVSGISYGAAFVQGGKARIELYIDRGKMETNKAIFDALLDDRLALETLLGFELAWERLDIRRASRVATYRPGSIDDGSEDLTEIHEWMIQNLLKFRETIGPKLAQILPGIVA